MGRQWLFGKTSDPKTMRKTKESDELRKSLAAQSETLKGAGDRIDSMHAQLAAKDADIAELKRVAGEWAKAYAYVTDILPLDPRNFARDPVCPMNLAEQDRHRVDVLRGERDEARECVRRLYSAMESVRNDLVGCMRDPCEEALAATPEHLRNA